MKKEKGFKVFGERSETSYPQNQNEPFRKRGKNMSKRNIYTDEFKKQIVMLYKNGKPVTKLVNEYNIARPTIYKWIKEYNNSGSFKTDDNRSEQEKELIRLRKLNQELLMENDILKQAALIMGRKQK
jgi:transposase